MSTGFAFSAGDCASFGGPSEAPVESCDEGTNGLRFGPEHVRTTLRGGDIELVGRLCTICSVKKFREVPHEILRAADYRLGHRRCSGEVYCPDNKPPTPTPVHCDTPRFGPRPDGTFGALPPPATDTFLAPVATLPPVPELELGDDGAQGGGMVLDSHGEQLSCFGAPPQSANAPSFVANSVGGCDFQPAHDGYPAPPEGPPGFMFSQPTSTETQIGFTFPEVPSAPPLPCLLESADPAPPTVDAPPVQPPPDVSFYQPPPQAAPPQPLPTAIPPWTPACLVPQPTPQQIWRANPTQHPYWHPEWGIVAPHPSEILADEEEESRRIRDRVMAQKLVRPQHHAYIIQRVLARDARTLYMPMESKRPRMSLEQVWTMPLRKRPAEKSLEEEIREAIDDFHKKSEAKSESDEPKPTAASMMQVSPELYEQTTAFLRETTPFKKPRRLNSTNIWHSP